MKHKLLPAMISAALVSGMGVAQADITVFGHLDTAIVNTDAENGFVNTTKMPSQWATSVDYDNVTNNNDTNVVCTTCSIGFKGAEDIGNGLKVIFKLDFQFDAFNRNKGSIIDRDQWLGLKGNFGTVRWGSISTSYKSHGAMIDPLYRMALQGRGVGLQSFLHSNAGEEGEGRADNTFRWDSPSWNGLKVTAHYTLDSDELDGSNRDGTNPIGREDDDAYGIGAQYSNGGILVFADYLTNDSSDADNAQGDLSAWKVGGKYTINNFAVMGQYEDISDGFYGAGVSGKQEMTLWHLAGSYTMGNNMVYLAYGQGAVDNIFNNQANGDDSESTAITIAGTHKLSNRTTIYAGYSMQEQDNDVLINNSLETFANGFKRVNDPKKDVFALGMKHKF